MTYYILLEDNKITGASQEIIEGQGLSLIETTEEIYNNFERYMWDGSNIVINPNYEQEEYRRRYEEVRKLREEAYMTEVDKITVHIYRLRDQKQTEEIITEINRLKNERDAKYLEIQERYPYPEEPK